MYAGLRHIYGFVHGFPGVQRQPLPKPVLSEVMLNLTLFPWWSADLRRPWWSQFVAPDASPAYGFGLSTAAATPEMVRAIAAAACDGDCVVRLTRTPGDPEEIPRFGEELRLPLTLGDFRSIFSFHAKHVAHPGDMELEAVRLPILRLTRYKSMHRHRGVILVDAQAVGFALRKGRSSAGSLRRGARATSSLCLITDLKLSFRYLPSESNPADYPSRNKSYRLGLSYPQNSQFKRMAPPGWLHLEKRVPT